MEGNPSMKYFRIKTEFTREQDNGMLGKSKIEELVLASTYTEAEEMACELIATWNRSQYGEADYEIIRTKIADVVFNDILTPDKELVLGCVGNSFAESEDSGMGLYAVRVIFMTVDERTAKEKRTTEVFYVPASSNQDAANRVDEYVKGMAAAYVIRDTKFDRAEAIYWPKDVYQSKASQFDLG